MKPPSYHDVVAKFRELIEGRLSPDDVAAWAMAFVREDASPDADAVWQAIMSLAVADAATGPSDGEYLYHDADFRAWLARLEKACQKSA